MAEGTAKVAGGHVVAVGERVRMRWGAKWAGVVRSISERAPTTGVGLGKGGLRRAKAGAGIEERRAGSFGAPVLFYSPALWAIGE
jgi:hypothetical protein